MPLNPSFEAEISAYQQEFLAQPQSASLRFEKLRSLHENFLRDSENYTLMKYGTSLIEADNVYENLKVTCKSEHQELKRLQKIIDDRTLMIEQQLYNGLPSDLKEMEKVITEQESILEHQQQLNQKEENLLEKMRKIDIEHGRKLALIEQESSQKKSPSADAKAAFLVQTNLEEKKITKSSKLLSLLPIILIPIALDFLGQKWGMQKIGENHYIFSHTVFLVVFLLMEIFFSDKIKQDISAYQSKKSCLKLLSTFQTQWQEAQAQQQKLEKQYGLSLTQVSGYLDGQTEKA